MLLYALIISTVLNALFIAALIVQMIKRPKKSRKDIDQIIQALDDFQTNGRCMVYIQKVDRDSILTWGRN